MLSIINNIIIINIFGTNFEKLLYLIYYNFIKHISIPCLREHVNSCIWFQYTNLLNGTINVYKTTTKWNASTIRLARVTSARPIMSTLQQ